MAAWGSTQHESGSCWKWLMCCAKVMVVAVVLVVAFAVSTASASQVQFAVAGAPMEAGEVKEVGAGTVVSVGIYVVPDEPFDTFWVEFVPTGPWGHPPLPQVSDLLGTGDVAMLSGWNNEYAYAGYDWDVYSIGGFLPDAPTVIGTRSSALWK